MKRSGKHPKLTGAQAAFLGLGMPKANEWNKYLNLKEVKSQAQAKFKKKNKLVRILSKFFKPTKSALSIMTKPYFWWLIGTVFVGLLILLIIILQDLPSPNNLTSSERFAVSTIIYDRNGDQLYEIFADENRIPVKLADLPPHVKYAAIAIEDKNFYRHFGFDLAGIVRALINNARGETIEGGSTITQQLVKNALLTKEKSLTRKAKEALLSVATEMIYSKDQILEMYLNYISYGGTSVGIEAAAQRYFDKNAKDLTIAEAALLAGLPQAPSKYSPFGSNPERAKERQLEVIRRMVEDKYISELEGEDAKSQTLNYALSQTEIKAPHFVFYLRDMLYEKYGVETVEKGGLRVYSTLDSDIQQAAQASLSAELKTLERLNVSNGAAMVTKPNTGEILAMVGSKDYFNDEIDGNVNVAISLRQPGSSIKPIMYAVAMQEKLLNPGSVLLDIPTCFTVSGQKPYCPKNYDGSFKGPVTIRQSLGNSLNIPAVKALRLIGVERFIDWAKKFGISTWTDPSQYGLSLTLGGGEVKMIDMAQAFSIIADQGIKVPLTPYTKITDYKGKVLEEIDLQERQDDLNYLLNYEDFAKNDLQRVLDPAPAYLTAHIMQDNQARTAAFGPNSQLVIPNQVVSAKTGTTNNLKDNWTVGFTPEYLTIVWVGNNDGSPMNPYLVSGITGAAPIWHDIMTYILKGKEPKWQTKPADVVGGKVCPTGLPADKSGKDYQCQNAADDLYWKDGKPTASKIETKEIWIKADTGLPPAFGEQAENLQLQTKSVYSDPLTKQYCADCARPVAEDGKTVYEQNTVTFDQKIELAQ